MAGEGGGGKTAATRALKRQPLWLRVDRNRLKLALFVTLFVAGSAVLLTVALVGVPGGLFGLAYTADVTEEAGWYWSTFGWTLVACLAGLLGLGSIAAAVQLANAEDWVRSRFKGAALPVDEHAAFVRVVEEMALAGGLAERPALVVVESGAVNAYALGTTRGRSTIGVTRGFLETVPAGEQRAVVAALVARIVSGDILFATALAALMGPLKAIRGSGSALLSGKAGCAGLGCADGCMDGCVSGPDITDGCGCLFDGLGDPDEAGGCLGMIAMFLFVAVIAAITYAAVVSAAWLVTLWGRLLHRTAYEKADAEGMLLLKDPVPMLSALARFIAADTTIADGDPSYDGIFYTPTSGTTRVERAEKRRLARLAEVLGVDGAHEMARQST